MEEFNIDPRCLTLSLCLGIGVQVKSQGLGTTDLPSLECHVWDHKNQLLLECRIIMYYASSMGQHKHHFGCLLASTCRAEITLFNLAIDSSLNLQKCEDTTSVTAAARRGS